MLIKGTTFCKRLGALIQKLADKDEKTSSALTQ